MPKAATKVHSSLGASKAHRWMACPGSVSLTRNIPDTSGKYADEGTAAHTVAELTLGRMLVKESVALKTPEKYVGFEVGIGTDAKGKSKTFPVDIEMAQNVRVYYDYVLGRVAKFKADGHEVVVHIERRFDFDALEPPEPIFGTADTVLVVPAIGLVEVVDLKYGKGIYVSADDNPQLKMYGLGVVMALEAAGLETPIKDVQLTIVQPRYEGADPIRSSTMSYVDVVQFAGELVTAANATVPANAPLKVGEHCHFCPAHAQCPAQRDYAQSLAVIEFTDVAPSPVDPAGLSLEDMNRILRAKPILDQWFKEIEARAFSHLEQGGELQDFKLVTKKSNRAWVSESEAEEFLQFFGLTPAQIHTRELISPTKAEELVGKGKLPDNLIFKDTSGHSMAPMTDKRPAIRLLTAAEEFSEPAEQ